MNTGTRLILRSLIQFAAGGGLTALIEAWLAPSVDTATLLAINTLVIIVLQNAAESAGIEWASPVKRPDKVDALDVAQ